MARRQGGPRGTPRDFERGYERLLSFTTEDVIAVHEGAARFGDTWDFGVRDLGGVELLVSRLHAAARACRPPAMIASEAMRDVVRFHPFWDANHRTALAMALMTLRAFGLRLVVSKEEVESFVRSIDAKNLGIPEVVRWVKKWVRHLR